MIMKPFDLTPDPRVLIALTHTPLKPLDAISEIIDNAIDSFTLARNIGNKVEHPLILVTLPTKADLSKDGGVVRIRDNGVGMSAEMAEKALKAGFSGNNPYDSLGLFGMGLNIATGKLGRRTTLLTARKEDRHAIKAVVDLMKIQESGSYEVSPELVQKPDDFISGSLIEVSGWWPEGNQNYGFIRKLIGYGKPKIRLEIGRRYSTLLRNKSVRILIDEEDCVPFEHCVWGDNRFVERREHGKIYAINRFSEPVGNQVRCTKCYALITNNENSCPACDSSSIRTIEEKVEGWVGIQRYDHTAHYGIDLIRNGRAIRLLEKAAFFEFTDEFGNTLKDYPADSQYGRIVGEVHLNHVPVDFMKQDFQRSSPEWQRAMTFVRGDSSLQPTQPGASNNPSPIYRLYQGFRRVRRFGKHDMYMGYWDEQSNSAKRIDRETEKDYLDKFTNKQPGFYDDSEWWRLVEEADSPPIEKLVECPICSADNLQTADQCQVCAAVLKGKPCVECHQEITTSATTCHHCGVSQIPVIEEPWTCKVCNKVNQAGEEICINCDSVRGSVNPLSNAYLKEKSIKNDELSIPGCSIKLADGTHSQAIDINSYVTSEPLQASWNGERIPAVVKKGEEIDIFIDIAHPLYKALNIKPHEIIASEIAYYLHVSNGRLSQSSYENDHTLTNLKWAILDKYWQSSLTDSTEQVKEDVSTFFSEFLNRIAYLLKELSSDIFDELSEYEKKSLIDNLIEANEDISLIGEMKSTGKFLLYIPPDTIVSIFKKFHYKLFDGEIWSQPYKTIPDIPETIMENVREQIKKIYLNCIEDCAYFLNTQKPDPVLVKRTRNSLQYLLKKLEV